MSGPISKSPPEMFMDVVTDAWTAPFWQAAAAHRLVAPRCGSCRRFRMPPGPFCPHCRSQKLEWPELSGDGVIYSYTIVSVPITPEMAESVPYVPAVISLPDADGVRLISNVVDAPIEALRVGAPVRVHWHDTPNGVALPQFVLAEDFTGTS